MKSALRTQFCEALANYDPYGFMQVSAAQSVFVMTGLFLINYIFAPHNFNTIVLLPAFSFFVVGREHSFNTRLRYMAVFCLITVIYAILLSIVQNYRYLVVFTVAVVILSLYACSKKYTYLLSMIPFMHVGAYVFLIIPNGGDWPHIRVFLWDSFLMTVYTLVLMLCFPRIYFFRVWLRSLQYTLKEFEEIIQLTITGKIDTEKFIAKHVFSMQDCVYALSYQEYGLSARKIALRCMNFYTFIVAVFSHHAQITEQELRELAQVFSRLNRAISMGKCLENIVFSSSESEQITKVHKNMKDAILYWNRLCRRLQAK